MNTNIVDRIGENASDQMNTLVLAHQREQVRL